MCIRKFARSATRWRAVVSNLSSLSLRARERAYAHRGRIWQWAVDARCDSEMRGGGGKRGARNACVAANSPFGTARPDSGRLGAHAWVVYVISFTRESRISSRHTACVILYQKFSRVSPRAILRILINLHGERKRATKIYAYTSVPRMYPTLSLSVSQFHL